MAPVLKRIYDQMPDPKWVISMGACASTAASSTTTPSMQGVDRIVPVDVYVPGCPPRPEALIYGIMKLQEKIDRTKLKAPHAAEMTAEAPAPSRWVGPPRPPSRRRRPPRPPMPATETTPGFKTITINMGPQHPSTHGVLRLVIELDGETVVRLRAVMGYLHTGIEKTLESKTYTQSSRSPTGWTYISPLGNNMGFTSARSRRSWARRC